jgi:XTP/dITP diphosphohydrolase
MKRFLFASNNPGKLSEVRYVADSFSLEILNPAELGKGTPPNPEETASTYLGNAKIKAESFFQWSGLPSLADDTGLEVDALAGSPGVFSARYAGPSATSEANVRKLLDSLRGVEVRTARFYCLLYFIVDRQNVLTAEAYLDGSIAQEPRGGGGFGYDNIFEVAGSGHTLAELKADGGHIETHRVLACRKLFSIITQES